MAEWPGADELKQVLDVTSEDWDETLDRVLASAIRRVKADVGNWVEYEDEPDENLSQAALRLAELVALRPEVAVGSVKDPTYNHLMKGHRRRFGVA